jgi:serine/threonine protein phosphatase PrpC
MAFRKTNLDLLQSCITITNIEIDINFSGSTTVMVFIDRTHLYCANIGDSRAILCSQDNLDRWSYKPLSIDHTAEVKHEADRILKCKGRLEPYRDEEGKQMGPYRIWLA